MNCTREATLAPLIDLGELALPVRRLRSRLWEWNGNWFHDRDSAVSMALYTRRFAMATHQFKQAHPDARVIARKRTDHVHVWVYAGLTVLGPRATFPCAATWATALLKSDFRGR